MHPILKRQLHKAGIADPDQPPGPSAWAAILEAVDRTYCAGDQDRYTLERSLHLCSEEMQELTAGLTAKRDELELVLQSVEQSNLALTQERNRLDTVVTHLEAGLTVVHASGRVLFANERARRWFGHGHNGAPWRCSDAHLGCTPHRAECPLNLALTTGRAQRREQEVEVPGLGKRRFLRIVSPCPGASGSLTEALDLALDVTEEHRLREDLVQAEKLSALGQMIAGIAHELNNPLGGILGYAQMLAGETDRAAIQEDLGTIYELAQRAVSVVRNLLVFARQTRRERLLFDIGESVRKSVDLYACEFRRAGIDCLCDIEEGLPRILGCEHQVVQVLINLLNNARQAILSTGRTDGSVAVTVRQAGGQVAVEVRDNGPGIAPEVRSRIFEPFYTTKPEGEGTGLGLSVSYAIIADHGGEVTVDSAPGKGASFAILLPPAGTCVVDPGAAATPPIARARGARVLVIDDETLYPAMVRRMLDGSGCTVDGTADPDEAVRLATGTPYDVILCDMRMPKTDGRSLYGQIVEAAPRYVGRVVFCTGDVLDREVEAFCEENGATCLAKPFEAEEVHAAVASVMRAKAAAG